MLDAFTKKLQLEDAASDNNKIIFEAIDATQVAPIVRNICLLSTDDGLAPSEREDKDLEKNLNELELTSGMNKDQQKQAVYDAVIQTEKDKIQESGGFII